MPGDDDVWKEPNRGSGILHLKESDMMRRNNREHAAEEGSEEGEKVPAKPPPGAVLEGSILSSEVILPSPCQLCGSEGPGTFCRMTGYGTLVGKDYVCPVLSYDCWGKLLSIPGEPLKLCPRRFVLAYGYDRYAVIRAVIEFENKGYGKFMSPTNLKQFRERAFQLCASRETCTCHG